MKKTAEEIAQWVIDNRYAKSENNKIDDRELYDTLVNEIKSYRSQVSELPSDEECNEIAFRKLLLTGRTESEEIQDRKLIIEGLTIMRSIASPLLASRDARIKELEEENIKMKLIIDQLTMQHP